MNFTTLAFCPLTRMNEVSRYSSVYQERNETLSEHTTEVSMMSYLIALELRNHYSESVDIGILLEKCLLHDMDEVITGDIPRNTKYASRLVHKEMNNVATRSVQLIEGMLSLDLKETWQNAKDGKEGLILKIVDMLCVAKKCITEIELRGNLTFLKVVSELETHLSNVLVDERLNSEFVKEDARKYLKGLITQAKDEITTIRVKYQNVIDKYHIKENVIEGE